MKTCRFCLGKTAESCIFDNSKTFFPKFLSYCNLEIYENDGLPQHVCVSCVVKLKEVIKFINQCEENDRILRLNLEVIKTEKEEIKDVPVEFKEENVELQSINDFNLSDFESEVKDEARDTFGDEKNSTVRCDDKNIKRNSRKKNEVSVEFKHENLELQSINDFDLSDFEHDTEDKAHDSFGDETDSKVKCDDKNIKQNIRKKRSRIKNKCESQLCPVCGKSYTKKGIREHLKTHGTKNLVCDECPKTFSTISSLHSHKISHSSVRKHKCEYCEKMFKTAHIAKMHMEYIHRKSKPLPCKVCGKIFYHPYDLKTHAVVHTKERKFECNKCNKAFSSGSFLKIHLRVHTGERPYACHFCDSKFSVLQSLKEHERLHTGEKPYKCPTCLKGFAQKGNMKSHFKYNHKGMDFKAAMLTPCLDEL